MVQIDRFLFNNEQLELLHLYAVCHKFYFNRKRYSKLK